MLVFTLSFCRGEFYQLIHGWKPFVGKPFVSNFIYVCKKKPPMVLQTENMRKKKNYPLEYTNRIISSVIGNAI